MFPEPDDQGDFPILFQLHANGEGQVSGKST
jgi:hypothetical protein